MYVYGHIVKGERVAEFLRDVLDRDDEVVAGYRFSV
jgi:hypothetical protein